MKYASKVRSVLSSFVVYTQYVINLPANTLEMVSASFSSKHNLAKENSSLNLRLLSTLANLQRLEFLEQENSQLRLLLNMPKQPKVSLLPTRLLSISIGNFDQHATIDKGSSDGVYVGQTILDAFGVFGQVVFTGPRSSKIILVTDKLSAIPVMVARSGMNAIAVGIGDINTLELASTQETADIKPGDLLVTSSLGKRFPPGYAVGVVREIKHVASERFVKVLVTPNARVNSSQNVLLVFLDNNPTFQKKNH